MGKALYRKYRSKKLSEIVGQEHVTTALSNALKNGTISHAYLFTGPRGVGKTSIARILAHEVNGLPYDETANHLDIIEIDAASNRRIDEIRTLRERVHSAPTSAKYKVYIIDEVHMLTKEAFNALLKTLEEPPEHVIFILATTEVHKLPETIISRTQRYTFKPAERSAATEHLKTIAKQEGLNISDEALALIAEHGGGSFRDSISLLDQVSNSGKDIRLEDVQRSLGIAPDEAVQNLIGLLQSGKPADVLAALTQLQEQGYQAPQIAKQLAGHLRKSLLENQLLLDAQATTQLLEKLLDVPASHDPKTLLEIILVDIKLQQGELTPIQIAASPAPAAPSEPTPAPEPKPEVIEDVKPADPPEAEPEPAAPPAPKKATDVVLDDNTWNQTLQTIKQKHNTLYGVARMAQPFFNGDELTLSFKFAFHQKRINEQKNKQVISDTIANLTGVSVTINCIVDKASTPAPGTSNPTPEPTNVDPAPPAAPSGNAPLDAISNIFGGAEVLE